jgi:hypothetical protein
MAGFKAYAVLGRQFPMRLRPMTIDTLRGVLLWSGIINYGILIWWVLLYLFARGLFHRIAKLYRVPAETFDVIQFSGIVIYKLAIFFFNFVPYLALRIVA